MKKYTMMILACVVAITAVLFLNFIRLHRKGETVSLPVANAKELSPAPDLKLQDLDQKEYVLSANKDKKSVIMLFWTTWCPYCPDELRELNDIYSGHGQDGMEILGINVEEGQGQVKDAVRSYKLKFKVLLDTSGSVRKAYGVLGVPTYVLIDKSGNIVFKGNYFPKEKYKELISK